MENKYTENGDKKNKYNRQMDGNGKRQGQNGRKKTWDRAAKQGSDWNIRPYLAVGLTIFLVFCCCIFVICMLFRFQVVRGVLRDIVKVSEPIIYGLVIGYLINPIMKFFERLIQKLDKNGNYRKMIRTVSSILAVLVFLLIIAFILYLIIPQLIRSVMGLIDTLPAQINSFIVHMDDWQFGNPAISEQIEKYLMMGADLLENWLTDSLLPQTKSYIASITSGVLNVLVALKNIVIGLIVSIYVMCEKENFEGQAKKIIFAVFPPRHSNVLIQVFHAGNEIFGGFIKGKLLDSMIIGIICYVVLSIIKMPYALLVSVIVGVTNVIPFFGPFIGGIPCAFLILLADPLYALYFIIFIVILQQVDGNIIGPKILGDSTGLSSFWVIFSIIVASGLFGVPGMLFGCPAFAVIYYIIDKFIHYLLRKKAMPLDTKVYVEATGVEPQGGKLRYGIYEDEVMEKEK